MDELRWQAPAPPESWDGVRLADSFGGVCPQALPPGNGVTRSMSEDCLTLNVWTAAKSGEERRPVYVWIYGGGFSGGSGSNPAFDGEYLANKGLVVVTFNYRLGALGFLATPELSEESGHHASGNYGLLDDIAVLKWVQDNISAFGGDSRQVTIVTLDAYLAAAKEKFGPMVDEFLKLYPASDDDEAAMASNAAARDNSRISTYLWGTLWTRHASRPVFTYFWTHRPPGPGHDMRGAYHGSEIAYSFGNASSFWTDEDYRVADIMSSYWANFITSGNPNGAGLPEWPAYDPEVPRVMELGENFAPIPVAGPARLDFWKRFFAQQDPW